MANVLRTIVGMAQLVQAAQGAPTWTVAEEDANGQYLASYARADSTRLSKRKLRYIVEADATHTGKPQSIAAPIPQLGEASFEITADARGRIREMQGRERVTLSLRGAHLSVETDAELHLSQSTVSMVSELVGDYQRRKDQLLIQPIQGASGDPRVQRGFSDRKALGRATLDQLWSELLAISEPANSAKNADTVRRFEALFRLQESSVAVILKRLPGTPEQQSKIVVDALTLAAAERLLDDANAERRQMARFAYGTLASKVAISHPSDADSMVRALLRRLESAANDEERGDLYLALGNTAAMAAFETLQHATAKGSLLLRAAALQAIGRINDPRVVPVLEEALVSKEQTIRMAAMDGIRRREIGPFLPALVKAAQTDTSPYVRSAAVDLLGSALDSAPQLRGVLSERSSKDSDAKVRAVAARVLDEKSAAKQY